MNSCTQLGLNPSALHSVYIFVMRDFAKLLIEILELPNWKSTKPFPHTCLSLAAPLVDDEFPYCFVPSKQRNKEGFRWMNRFFFQAWLSLNYQITIVITMVDSNQPPIHATGSIASKVQTALLSSPRHEESRPVVETYYLCFRCC